MCTEEHLIIMDDYLLRGTILTKEISCYICNFFIKVNVVCCAC